MRRKFSNIALGSDAVARTQLFDSFELIFARSRGRLKTGYKVIGSPPVPKLHSKTRSRVFTDPGIARQMIGRSSALKALGAVTVALTLLISTVAFAGEAPKHSEAAEKEGGSNEVKLTPAQIKLVEIKTSPVKTAVIAVELVVNGEITANQEKTVQVLAKTSGVVSAIKTHLGDRVRTNDTMAIIASRELAEAEAAYATTKSKADLAKLQLTREENLWRQKATSEQEYLAARAAANQAVAEVEAAEQRLKLLESGHTAGTVHAKDTVVGVSVTAPFDGTIIEKRIALGDQVNDQSPLFKIADLEKVWVIANIYEKDLARVAVGQPARVSVRAYPERVFEGPITWVAAVLDEKTRTLKARIELENKAGLLKPGSFATVMLKITTNANGMVVPPAAVQRQKSETIVFVKTADGVFQRREVKIGERTADTVEIIDGLKEGETVVTSGSFILKSELEKAGFAE